MDIQSLQDTASKMMQKRKGILAADESESTAGKRLESVGAENTEENRRLYRELFLNTPGIENYISGVILHEETLNQKNNDGVLFVTPLLEKGIVPGIKVDKSTVDFPGFPEEKLTEGLDGLRERLKEYYKIGARFAKWRTVITIGKNIPTKEVVQANIVLLSLYARMCQEEGIVPMVEPEVLLDGDHTMQESEEVTTNVVSTLMKELSQTNVDLRGVILKTSMVLPGNKSNQEVTAKEVAEATVRMLKTSVPTEIAGVVFLSGGQEPIPATEHLDAIAELEPLPWEIAFSYARALQGPALEIWKGDQDNVERAREEFIRRLKLNVKADAGAYELADEKR